MLKIFKKESITVTLPLKKFTKFLELENAIKKRKSIVIDKGEIFIAENENNLFDRIQIIMKSFLDNEFNVKEDLRKRANRLEEENLNLYKERDEAIEKIKEKDSSISSQVLVDEFLIPYMRFLKEHELHHAKHELIGILEPLLDKKGGFSLDGITF